MNFYIKKTVGSVSRKRGLFWQKAIRAAAIIIAVVGILGIFQNEIRNIFWSATAPLTMILREKSKAASGFFSPILSITEITQENNNLKEENLNLLMEVSRLEELIRQNNILREGQSIAKANRFSVIGANIIGLDWGDDLISIDKGLADGILENMPVISGQNVTYGKVIKVYDNFSKVMLISNKNSTLDVKIASSEAQKTPIQGIVRGLGNLSFYLDLVPSQAEIKEGDVLVTSALEGTFPRDLLVGKIISRDQNDVQPFQTARVMPFLDVKNADSLFIITNYKR